MENLKIILESGQEKEVSALFYLYNSNYYFIYTEKELDENGYVVLKLVQVGKEVKKTENGTVETGYMVGVAPADWENVQKSVTKIVEDKKNGTASPEIQYLPMTMLTTLKISSNKTIRLVKSAVEQYFGINFEEAQAPAAPVVPETPVETPTPLTEPEPTPTAELTLPSDTLTQDVTPIVPSQDAAIENSQEAVTPALDDRLEFSTPTQEPVVQSEEESSDVIVDYRKSFFEEQEKVKNLEAKVQELTDKLNKISEILN